MAEIMTVLSLRPFSLGDSGRDILRIGDGIALEHFARLPSADVHDGGLGYPCSAKFACC